jgi:hypothetical protein
LAVLFLHEVHQVAGRAADEFETAYREGWMPALAGGPARLLWFLHQAHGAGPAYTFITVTAVESAAAWAELNERVRRGDLQQWALDVDALRHGSTAKVLEPTAFSELQSVDLAGVATDGREHEHSLFMEDTAWPDRGQIANYLEKAGTLYAETLKRSNESGRGLLQLVAAFRPAFGAGRDREVVLWQRVGRPEGLLPLFSREVPAEYRKPGTWMNDALDLRDQWESRLLRTAQWSPLD